MDFSQLLDSFIPFAGALSVLRAILAIILMCFLPGFAWTLVLFTRINTVERIALSLGLSIAVVTLSIIVLNYIFGMRINGINSLTVIILITVIALVIYALKRLLTHKKMDARGD
jgi:uncharacterized membrane protein